MPPSWLLVADGSPCCPWLVAASLPSLTLLSHGHPLFVFVCSPLTRTPVRGYQSLDLGPTLIQYDLILTNYICEDSVSR